MPTVADPARDPDPEVTRRLEQFLRARDTRLLWPDLVDAELLAAHRDIEHVVRAVLAGAPARLEGAHPDRLYALKIAALTTGTGALLGRWIEDGRVHASADVAALLGTELRRGRLRADRIRAGVLPVLDALVAHGLAPVVMKGMHIGLAYAEEPGVRPLADVDVVVPLGRGAEAEAIMRALGFEHTGGHARPYESHWRARHDEQRVFEIEGIDPRGRWEVDVHDSFDRLFPGTTVRLETERHALEPLRIDGHEVQAPAQPLLLFVLATQLSLDLKATRLMRLVDLIRVIRTDHARGVLAWDGVLAAARRARVEPSLYPALTLAEDLAPGTVDAEVLATLRRASPRALRNAVAGMTPSGDPPGRTNVMMYLMWARGPLHALRIIAATLFDMVAGGPRAWRGHARTQWRRWRAGRFHLGVSRERATDATPPRPAAPRTGTRSAAPR